MAWTNVNERIIGGTLGFLIAGEEDDTEPSGKAQEEIHT